jgi:hypothetical protein
MMEVTPISPIDPNDPIVLIEDVRALKLCMSGCRDWINTWGPTHGFTWTKFITEGYRASEFDATGDHLIKRVTDQARKRARKLTDIEKARAAKPKKRKPGCG